MNGSLFNPKSHKYLLPIQFPIQYQNAEMLQGQPFLNEQTRFHSAQIIMISVSLGFILFLIFKMSCNLAMPSLTKFT